MEREQGLLNLFKKRLTTYILVTFLIAILLITFGSLFIAFNAINEKRVAEAEEHLENIRSKPRIEIFFSIFTNNYIISLNFLPPLVGQIFFVTVMYHTSEILAMRISEISNSTSESFLFLFLVVFSLMFNPYSYFFGFLEFLGYSLTLSQSFFLISSSLKSIRNRNLQYLIDELKFTFLIVVASAIVLLLAAYLESLVV